MESLFLGRSSLVEKRKLLLCSQANAVLWTQLGWWLGAASSRVAPAIARLVSLGKRNCRHAVDITKPIRGGFGCHFWTCRSKKRPCGLLRPVDSLSEQRTGYQYTIFVFEWGCSHLELYDKLLWPAQLSPYTGPRGRTGPTSPGIIGKRKRTKKTCN